MQQTLKTSPNKRGFMGKDQISAPSSQTGLMRFYDVTSSSVQIDPKIVMAACVAVIVLELVFHLF
jgi:preprotein translocase subunit Sec61beta